MKWFVRCLALVLCFSAKQVVAETYVIGVEANDYLPYWKAEGSKYTGFGKDFFDAFASHSGHQFKFAAYPVKRCLDKLLTKEIDAKFPDNSYWSQDAKAGHDIQYSDPVIPYTDGLLVLPERKGMSPSEVTKIGTMIGFTPWAYIDDVNSGRITLRENTKMEAALKMGISNRVDGVYFNPVAARYLMKTSGLGENALVFDPGLPHTNSNYHMSSIKHPALIKELNTFMSEKADVIMALKKQYGIE